MNYTKISTCRVCSSDALKKILSLGNQRVVDFTDLPTTDKPVVPLNLMICEKCHLVQLEHTTEPDVLFKEFWYRSGINEMMKRALTDIVVNSIDKAKVHDGDVVCDIGCNDGTMLDLFPENITTVGFDPSNIIRSVDAQRRMNFAINNYFNRTDALNICQHIGKKFKLITAIAMFYDLDDPAQFLQDCKSVLTDDGMIVIQMNYLMSMIQQNAIDNICHEHLTYFSLTSLRWFINKIGLEIVDVETNQVNGGSFRVYLKKIPLSRSDITGDGLQRIKDLLNKEKEFGIDKIETYTSFGIRIKEQLQQLLDLVTEITLKGNPVYAYGASTRGTVLLQSTPFPLSLAGVAERDTNKLGKYMVANWLLISDEEHVRSRCQHMLVLPWHFKEAIVEREKEWLNNGGTLIFPLPKITLVTKDGEKQIN